MADPREVGNLIEVPYTARILAAARLAVRRMFDRYQAENIDNWEPAPMPEGWVPPRREVD